MSATNPYQAPRSNVDFQHQDAEYGEVKVLSISGRIGRLRYLGYSMAYGLLIYVVMGALAGASIAMGAPQGLMMALIGVAYLGVIVLAVMLAIQRAHDFNTTGWLALLVFVPLANLVFLFIPGTDGENRFGKQPPPNRGVGIWVAIILVGVMLIGIVAAIAIPAYQTYVKRAQAAAQSNIPAPAQPQ